MHMHRLDTVLHILLSELEVERLKWGISRICTTKKRVLSLRNLFSND